MTTNRTKQQPQQTAAQIRLQRQLEDNPGMAGTIPCYSCSALIGDAEYRVTVDGCIRHQDCGEAARDAEMARKIDWATMCERIDVRMTERKSARMAIELAAQMMTGIKELDTVIKHCEASMEGFAPEAQPNLRVIVEALKKRRNTLIADAHVAAFAGRRD